jgi:5-methylcytosine-specific restriction enzyme A
MSDAVARKVTLTGTVFIRDSYVAASAKKLADGVCDLCKQAAPFFSANNEPYLESHHIDWLSRGGADSIDNVVALCPNCHRKMHIRNNEADRNILIGRITGRNS